MKFRLGYSPRALVDSGKGLVEDTHLLSRLPDEPAFAPCVVGSYPEIARHAVILNNTQERAGIVDWLYSPEPAGVA